MRPSEHVNEIVFAGDILKIGRWRLPAEHRNFTDSGPTKNYLFVFPRTAGWIEHAGGRAFVADPNIVTYYNRHQEYVRRAINPAGDHSDYYAIDQHVLRQIVAVWDPAAAETDRILRVTHGPSDAFTYLQQRMVYTHVRRSPSPDALFVEETMVNVLERLMEMAYGQQGIVRSDRQRDLVEHAREVLASHFAAPLTLTALARAAGSSVFHLCRLFRGHTGLTIHAYRNQLRLRTALGRVAEPSIDLSALAFDLGFSSHSHFTSAFRQLYGLTPSELRRQANERRLLNLACAASSGRRTP